MLVQRLMYETVHIYPFSDQSSIFILLSTCCSCYSMLLLFQKLYMYDIVFITLQSCVCILVTRSSLCICMYVCVCPHGLCTCMYFVVSSILLTNIPHPMIAIKGFEQYN